MSWGPTWSLLKRQTTVEISNPLSAHTEAKTIKAFVEDRSIFPESLKQNPTSYSKEALSSVASGYYL